MTATRTIPNLALLLVGVLVLVAPSARCDNHSAVSESVDDLFASWLEDNGFSSWITTFTWRPDEGTLYIRSHTIDHRDLDAADKFLEKAITTMLFRYAELAQVEPTDVSVLLTETFLLAHGSFDGSNMVFQFDALGCGSVEYTSVDLDDLSELVVGSQNTVIDASQQRLRELLESRFASSAKEYVTLENGPFLRYEVLYRGELVERENFWEQLEISLYTVVEDDKLRLISFVDGRYASGLTRPKDADFDDLQPQYTSALQSYQDELLVYLIDSISREGDY